MQAAWTFRLREKDGNAENLCAALADVAAVQRPQVADRFTLLRDNV
jgi:hypothetical protein